MAIKKLTFSCSNVLHRSHYNDPPKRGRYWAQLNRELMDNICASVGARPCRIELGPPMVSSDELGWHGVPYLVEIRRDATVEFDDAYLPNDGPGLTR